LDLSWTGDILAGKISGIWMNADEKRAI